MNESPSNPTKPRKKSTPQERLARADQAVTKAQQAIERQQTRVAAAQAREAKAAATLQARTARMQKHTAIGSKRNRALDTRRKIIVGALALKHMEFDGLYAQTLRALIDEYVTRDQDRSLFELPPLPDNDQRRVNPPMRF